MLPSPTDIQYFQEVARSLNLSRASERLGITQPTLTVSMKRLEKDIGAEILIRSKTGVKLTRAGQRLLGRSNKILEEWRDLKSEIAKEDNELSGTYSIGCHTSVALYTLPHFVTRLMKSNSSLELNLSHDLSRKINEDVINFKLDFGIVINPVRHPDLVIKHICTDEVILWTGSSNSNKDVLICDQNLIQTQSILKKLQKGNFKRVISTPDLEVVTALTSTGAGCGIIPSRVAQRNKSLNLKPLPGSWPKFNDKVALVYRADSQKSPAARRLVEIIFTELKKKV